MLIPCNLLLFFKIVLHDYCCSSNKISNINLLFFLNSKRVEFLFSIYLLIVKIYALNK